MSFSNAKNAANVKAVLVVLHVLCVAALLAAHYLRAGDAGLAVMCASMPTLLLFDRRWTVPLLRLGALYAGAAWISSGVRLLSFRIEHGAPWLRLALILSAAAAVSFAACLSLRLLMPRVSPASGRSRWQSLAPLWAFVATLALLASVQLLVSRPMLLAERALVGAGWLQIAVAATYAASLTAKLMGPASAAWRRRSWLLFACVFFAQLGLGLAGQTLFLMAPHQLHWPIPAIIVAGPIYRGGPLFMVILFASTVLLVGPAWCSHLCYFGAWDQLLADRRKRPAKKLPSWLHWGRPAALFWVVAGALVARVLGATALLASCLALSFGLVGVGIMLLASRRVGVMVHCIGYCPLGQLATWLGRLSPFRLRVGDACNGCGACQTRCRYGALEAEHLARRQVGPNCTLCGDCLSSCRSGQLLIKAPLLSPAASRAVFTALVAALHVATLCLARV